MRDDGLTNQTSSTDRRLLPTAGLKRKAERLALDFVTWRARIAAPGSRFEPAQMASARIVRFDTANRAAMSTDVERRTA